MNVNPIKKTLERELKNLVFQNRNNLDVLKIEEKYFKNTQMNKRILIEWSNPKSEFQIQFINPRNRYFNWVHEMEEDDRIKKEIDLGYTMEEFELYDDLKGDWVINAEFLGNLDKNRSTPLVLLCSIYSNFGYPNQTKKVIVLHLNKQQRRKEMARFKI
jgi:hypothetical protein